MIHEMVGETTWKAIVSNYRELQKHQLRLVAKLEEAVFHEEPLAKVGEAYISSLSVLILTTSQPWCLRIVGKWM